MIITITDKIDRNKEVFDFKDIEYCYTTLGLLRFKTMSDDVIYEYPLDNFDFDISESEIN